MGTGIGKECQICEEQLNHDEGFCNKEEICSSCQKVIPKVLSYLANTNQLFCEN